MASMKEGSWSRGQHRCENYRQHRSSPEGAASFERARCLPEKMADILFSMHNRREKRWVSGLCCGPSRISHRKTRCVVGMQLLRPLFHQGLGHQDLCQHPGQPLPSRTLLPHSSKGRRFGTSVLNIGHIEYPVLRILSPASAGTIQAQVTYCLRENTATGTAPSSPLLAR